MKKNEKNSNKLYVIAFFNGDKRLFQNSSLIELTKKYVLKGKYEDEFFDITVYPTIKSEKNSKYFNTICKAPHYDNILYFDPNVDLKIDAFIFNQHYWDRLGINAS